MPRHFWTMCTRFFGLELRSDWVVPTSGEVQRKEKMNSFCRMPVNLLLGLVGKLVEAGISSAAD